MLEYHLHGPPGCGKTYKLANVWVPRAVERFGPDAVLVASLTKTAAQEIASRLPLPRERIGTLHSHAYRALGSPPLLEKHVDDWNDRHQHWALGGGSSGDEGDRDVALMGKPSGTRLMEALGVLRHRMVPEQYWPPDVLAFGRAWKAWKEELDVIDFDDMIELALSDVPTAPQSPQVLIVDEAQDCSILELALIRKWAQHASYVVLAGDGDQAIFGWRGADAEAFLGGDIPEAHNYKLTQSFRVPRAVHAVASRWIAQAQKRYAVEYHPRDFEGSVYRSPTSARMPQAFVAEIQEQLRARVARQGSVMVLATCSYMLTKILRELRSKGVPFHNPYRVTNGAWNPMRGGVDRLACFLAPSPHFADDDHPASLWNIRQLQRWVEVVKANVLPRGAKAMIAERAAAQRRRDEIGAMTPEYARELIGDDLFERIQELTLESRDDPLRSAKWLEANLLESKRAQMQFAFDIVRNKGLRALREKPRVIVGTIHSVKGGEAEHVHLLPDLARSSFQGWVTPGPSRDAVLRLFYVAATRASETLTIHAKSEPFAVDL